MPKPEDVPWLWSQLQSSDDEEGLESSEDELMDFLNDHDTWTGVPSRIAWDQLGQGERENWRRHLETSMGPAGERTGQGAWVIPGRLTAAMQVDDDRMQSMPMCRADNLMWMEKRFQVHIICMRGDLPLTLHLNILKFHHSLSDEAFVCNTLMLMENAIRLRNAQKIIYLTSFAYILLRL